jgi:ABC-2 type transport system ATP-binding protein
MVRGIRDRGKTVLLTTHLMEEAERLCDRVAIVERGRVVDIGTPAGLIRRHCPDQSVVLVTDDGTAEARFRRIPCLDDVTRQHSKYTLRGRGDDVVSAVIQCLSEHGIRVSEFRTVVPTLEDVFLEVTGHSIRD